MLLSKEMVGLGTLAGDTHGSQGQKLELGFVVSGNPWVFFVCLFLFSFCAMLILTFSLFACLLYSQHLSLQDSW